VTSVHGSVAARACRYERCREGSIKSCCFSGVRDSYLGRAADRSVGLRLMDEKGREHLRVRVNTDGSPVIQFLDADGKVTAQLPDVK
jgi:hypothetical protein